MSDETLMNESGPDLDSLKEKARLMGITFSGNIGVDSLRKKIQDKLNGAMETEEPVVPKAKTLQEIRTKVRAEGLALVRCKIDNLNPDKTDLRGEIISVSNRFLGTVSKFIPFGDATDNGYHIPKAIYDNLVSRKFQSIRVKKVDGKEVMIPRMVAEYSIQVMPPLNPEELKELALKQAAAERMAQE